MRHRSVKVLPRRDPENAAGEYVDEAFDEIDELMQRWHNRLSVKNLTLAERYLKGELEFGIVFVLGVGPATVGPEYVAVFERKFPVDGPGPCHDRARKMIRPGTPHVKRYSEHLVRGGYRDEQSMFVGDVETVQTVQGIVPSTVRLQSIEEFERIRLGASQIAVPHGRVGREARTYWESCFARCRPSVINDKGMREVVEGRPQIVGDVPDRRAPFLRNGHVDPKAVEFVTRFRCSIDHDGIRMQSFMRPNGRFELRKMFFGPVDLYTDAA
jgi:hypothetical protein